MAKLAFCVSVVFGIFLTSQSTTAQTTTTLDPLTEPCRMGRIRPDEQKNRFQQLTQDAEGNNVWVVMNCQEDFLEWDQVECKCDHPSSIRSSICDYEAYGTLGNQYQPIQSPQKVFQCVPSDSTFWNQTGCRCDWIPGGPMTVILPPVVPCETKFFSTFDSVADVDPMVKMDNWQPVPLSPAAGANGMAYFSNANDIALVSSMAWSDLGNGMAIDFRFKSFNDLGTKNLFVALVSSGCLASWLPGGVQPETFAVAYRSSDVTYELTLMSQSLVDGTLSTNSYQCQDATVADGFQWNTVSMSYAEGVITLTVNGVVCLGEVIPNSKPAQPKCPMAIGADHTALRRPLFGYVDELRVRRYCQGPVVA